MDRDPAERALIPSAAVSEQTRHYIARSKANRTIRAYRSDTDHFEAWCVERGHPYLPATPETVADYISDLADAGMAAATITRRLSAISQGHKMAGLETPTQNLANEFDCLHVISGSRRPALSVLWTTDVRIVPDVPSRHPNAPR